jgi:SPP1 family holin
MNKAMIIRTIVLVFALINQSLVMAGYSPLPFDDAQVENGVTIIFTVVAAVTNWWYDNDVTRKARENKAKLNEINK